jgi:hypothetical protein
MAHNRKFVPGVIDMVKIRLPNLKYTVSIQDDIEKIMIDSHFLEEAPFKWVGLIYRLGIKNDLKPEYQRINKKYGDLPIAVEIDTDILKWADRNDVKLLKDLFMMAGLEALIDVGKKYKLPTEKIEAERAKYGPFPNSVEELESLYQSNQ